MKIGFISDTHGNLDYTKDAIEYLSDCEKILHLGDVLAHGPRNKITDGYNPKDLAEYLKTKDNIYYIRGNCDADVDEMVTEKEISKSEDLLSWGDLTIYATHGYLESDNSRFYKGAENKANLVVNGHTHIKVLEKIEGIVILNPGSVSLPKDGSRSLAYYEDGKIFLVDLDTKEIIKELKI